MEKKRLPIRIKDLQPLIHLEGISNFNRKGKWVRLRKDPEPSICDSSNFSKQKRPSLKKRGIRRTEYNFAGKQDFQ
jgi:hypothetical protein